MIDEGRPGRVFCLKEWSQEYPCQNQARQKDCGQPEPALGSVHSTDSLKLCKNKMFDTMIKDNINFSQMEWKEA